MAELKIGGNNVKSLMYKDKDVSGSQMLESGTILYLGSAQGTKGNVNVKLPSVKNDWSNIKSILIKVINSYDYKVAGGFTYFIQKTIDISTLKELQTITYSSITVTVIRTDSDEGAYILLSNTTPYFIEISVA